MKDLINTLDGLISDCIKQSELFQKSGMDISTPLIQAQAYERVKDIIEKRGLCYKCKNEELSNCF